MRKLSDPNFLDIVYYHDTVILSEIWLAKTFVLIETFWNIQHFIYSEINHSILKKNASVEETQYIIEHILKKKFI